MSIQVILKIIIIIIIIIIITVIIIIITDSLLCPLGQESPYMDTFYDPLRVHIKVVWLYRECWIHDISLVEINKF